LPGANLYRMACHGAVAKLKADYQLQKLINFYRKDGKIILAKNGYKDMALRQFAHECARHKIYRTCNRMCRICGLNISVYSYLYDYDVHLRTITPYVIKDGWPYRGVCQ
jgi:hypothetical protein